MAKVRGRKTKQFLMEETFKSTTDPLYYLQTYGMVIHPKLGKMKMEAFPFQS